MQHRLQDNYVLNRLVAEFEAREDDYISYFDDKELIQIISFYESEGEYDKAIEVAEIGLNQFAFNIDFYILKARLLIMNESFDEVLQCVILGQQISPAELELEILEIYALIYLEESEKALEKINALLSLYNGEDRVKVLLCKARLHEQQKNYESMFNALKKALIIDPNSEIAVERIWIAVELCKNYKESILLHNHIIDKNPYNHQAWFNLGHAYACLGEYAKSIMALEYSFLIQPDFEVGYKDCAEMCFQIGRNRQALNIYLDAYQQFGPDMELLVSIGRCYLDIDQPKDARKFLKKATKIDPYDDEAHYYLGRSYFASGNFEEAIKCFSEAIKIDDRREEYLSDIAKAYHLSHDYTLANYYFQKSTEAGPEEIQYWFHHMLFLMDINAIDAVEEVLSEAENNTYGTEMIYVKAAIAFRRKNKKLGMEFLTEAIEENSSLIPTFYTLYPKAEKNKEIQALISYYSG